MSSRIFSRAAAIGLIALFALGPGIGTLAAAPAPSQVTLQLAKTAQFGSFLTDGNGNTLYMYTKDTKGVTNCYGGCAQAWPPLISDGGAPMAKDGISAALIGTVKRTDGTTQVSYNGWPLYYWVKDAKPGDTTGQAVGKVWWLVSSEGLIIRPAALKVTENAKLGKILTDDQGNTLYMYAKDSASVTNCYGGCAQSWPPLLSVGAASLGAGLDASLIGSIARKDGTTQVTYKGWPLYYYLRDVNTGDAMGQEVGKVWYVLAPSGEPIKPM